jgi:hypothetical protein
MFSDPNLVNWVYTAIALFLPIVPAFIFYKFLPAKADVSGPLQGLQIKLAGAFAGYFVLFFLVFFSPRPVAEPFEIWTVMGRVGSDSPILKDDEIVVSLIPPPVETYLQPDSALPVFRTSVLVTRKADGSITLPQLRIDRQPQGKFEPITIPLDDGFYSTFPSSANGLDIQRDRRKHEIDIKGGITLKKAPSVYSSAGTQ